jgi:hypothetical protein
MREGKPSAKDLEQPGAEAKKVRGSVNRDPLTGAPGAHPVGVELGALAGGLAAGAAAGTVAGPVGTAMGAAVGAVVGGLAGKAAAEFIDPTLEDAYWREEYRQRPYVTEDAPYEDYGPAYRYGLDAYTRRDGRSFDEAETDLATGWMSARGTSRLAWDHARHAARDAWERAGEQAQRTPPADADSNAR